MQSASTEQLSTTMSEQQLAQLITLQKQTLAELQEGKRLNLLEDTNDWYRVFRARGITTLFDIIVGALLAALLQLVMKDDDGKLRESFFSLLSTLVAFLIIRLF